MTQINTVAEPIINSPYDEPRYHWLIREGLPPQKRQGRRAASYCLAEEHLLDTANLLRQRVKEWRERRNYEGATRVTRELLELWSSPDRREPMFFAQKEAAETVIFLVEGPADLRQGVRIPADEPGPDARVQGYRALTRYAVKMATGSGKTTVMGMLAAWSILNKLGFPQSGDYSDTVLIVCPNVTIRDRLRELDPALDEASLYRTRELVPLHRMAALRQGDVIVTNWHLLERREVGAVNGQTARIVKRGVPIERDRRIKLGGKDNLTEADVRHAAAMGAYTIAEEIRDRRGHLTAFCVQQTVYLESEAAFVKRILGARRGRGAAIMVMNDEAHHAHRRGNTNPEHVVDGETLELDAREATVWIEGLDRINKVLGRGGAGIRMALDLSATPFYLQGSGNEVRPFPWVVSDFSLLDAIESGLVKIPQLTLQDPSGSPTPAYFNLWRWVQERSQADGLSGELSSVEVMRYAQPPILQLAGDWRKTAATWQQQFEAGMRHSNVPPVFIIVCRNTALAKMIYEWLALGEGASGQGVPEFRNTPGQEVTVRIDSKVAEDLASGGGQDEARRLRFVLETIGKSTWPGGRIPEEYAALATAVDPVVPPGRNIRCIISVSMLSEGWDATTVTHVVGLRPFGSQLLCEQVIGRALRRTSYAIDPAKSLFREETAKVCGVPFEWIPFKVEGTREPVMTPPANHIFSVPEKASYEIIFPVVEGYTDPGVTRVVIAWDRVPRIVLDSAETPDATRARVQQIAFQLARELTVAWIEDHGDTIPTHVLFPQLLQQVTRFLGEKVECRGCRRVQDIAINPYFGHALAALRAAMYSVDESSVDEAGASTEHPIVVGTRSTRTVDFHTAKPISPVQKCHLNAGVLDTHPAGQQPASVLDTHPRVTRWVKNERLGFAVPYRRAGVQQRYSPDLLAVLADATQLVIETNGRELPDVELKAAAARRWCRAVNNDSRFGHWTYLLVSSPSELHRLLDSHERALELRAAVL